MALLFPAFSAREESVEDGEKNKAVSVKKGLLLVATCLLAFCAFTFYSSLLTECYHPHTHYSL